jgi:hypothetical protein
MPEVMELLLGRHTRDGFHARFYVSAIWRERQLRSASCAEIAWEALWLANKGFRRGRVPETSKSMSAGLLMAPDCLLKGNTYSKRCTHAAASDG